MSRPSLLYAYEQADRAATAAQVTRTRRVLFMGGSLYGLLDEPLASRVATRVGTQGPLKKEAPLKAGLMVACLLVLWRSVVALLVLVRVRSLLSRLLKKEQALCQTIPTRRRHANQSAGPSNRQIASLRNMSRRKSLASCQNPRHP